MDIHHVIQGHTTSIPVRAQSRESLVLILTPTGRNSNKQCTLGRTQNYSLIPAPSCLSGLPFGSETGSADQQRRWRCGIGLTAQRSNLALRCYKRPPGPLQVLVESGGREQFTVGYQIWGKHIPGSSSSCFEVWTVLFCTSGHFHSQTWAAQEFGLVLMVSPIPLQLSLQSNQSQGEAPAQGEVFFLPTGELGKIHTELMGHCFFVLFCFSWTGEQSPLQVPLDPKYGQKLISMELKITSNA